MTVTASASIESAERFADAVRDDLGMMHGAHDCAEQRDDCKSMSSAAFGGTRRAAARTLSATRGTISGHFVAAPFHRACATASVIMPRDSRAARNSWQEEYSILVFACRSARRMKIRQIAGTVFSPARITCPGFLATLSAAAARLRNSAQRSVVLIEEHIVSGIRSPPQAVTSRAGQDGRRAVAPARRSRPRHTASRQRTG